jgi:DNA-binding IclR family transcriptional regulator
MEVPGTRLTAPEIARLCHLAEPICRRILDRLVELGALVLNRSGRYGMPGESVQPAYQRRAQVGSSAR